MSFFSWIKSLRGNNTTEESPNKEKSAKEHADAILASLLTEAEATKARFLSDLLAINKRNIENKESNRMHFSASDIDSLFPRASLRIIYASVGSNVPGRSSGPNIRNGRYVRVDEDNEIHRALFTHLVTLAARDNVKDNLFNTCVVVTPEIIAYMMRKGLVSELTAVLQEEALEFQRTIVKGMLECPELAKKCSHYYFFHLLRRDGFAEFAYDICVDSIVVCDGTPDDTYVIKTELGTDISDALGEGRKAIMAGVIDTHREENLIDGKKYTIQKNRKLFIIDGVSIDLTKFPSANIAVNGGKLFF